MTDEQGSRGGRSEFDQKEEPDEHGGNHVVFQHENGEFGEDMVEGPLDDEPVPGIRHPHSLVSAEPVCDVREPPAVVPPMPDPQPPIEPEPGPTPEPDTVTAQSAVTSR
jgi:hypothetical protein